MTVCNREQQRKEPSIIAGSFDSPRTGDHFGVIQNDDPHNEKNIGTIDQIQKVRDGWEAQGALDDGNLTRRIYVATRWHHQDVNDLIMQKCAPVFYRKFTNKQLLYNKPVENIENNDSMAVFLMAVWADEDESDTIWPEKKSKESVLKWKQEVGAYLFSCQMLNDPVPPEDQTFKQDDFRYYEITTEINQKGMPELYFICGEKKIGISDDGTPMFEYRKIAKRECVIQMTVDPAFGIKANNDYTAIIVAAHWIEPQSRMRWIIVLETVRERMTMGGSQSLIEEIATRHGITEVHIEKQGCNSIYLEQMASHPKWGGQKNIRVVPIKRIEGHIQGKSRVTRLEPYVQSHRLWFAPQMRQGPLEQELLAFVGGMSRGAHDDLADAMSDHCEIGHRMKVTDYDPLDDLDGWGQKTKRQKDIFGELSHVEDRNVWRML